MSLFWIRNNPEGFVMQVEERSNKYLWCVYLLTLTLAMMICGVVVVYYYRTQMSSFYERADASSLSEIELQETILRKELEEVSSDIRLLAVNPVMQRHLDTPNSETHHDLMVLWKRFLTERENYDQIRYMDVDGKEVIRVDYNNKVPTCLPESELQDKSDAHYFQEINALRRGKTFVSTLDLNQENGVPEYPFKPTVRFGIGLYDSQSKRVGSLVVNYNIHNFINIIKSSTQVGQTQFMLINADGYWVMHPNSDFEWGQYIPGNKDVNFATMHPEAWKIMSSQKRGKFSVGDEVYDFDTFDLKGYRNFVRPKRVVDDSVADVIDYDTQLKYVAALPAEVIQGYRKHVYNECLLIIMFWFVLALLPSWGLASFVVGHYHEKTLLSRHAHFDSVTGLANRVLFNERFEHALQMAERYSRICGLLYIDLDGFKQVNDEYGHYIGDELLASVATRMLQCVRKTDTVARIGGDEFAVLLTELNSKSDAMIIGEKIVSRMYDPVSTTKGPVNVGASIGVAVYPDDGQDTENLTKLADKFMYNNKRARKLNLGVPVVKEAS